MRKRVIMETKALEKILSGSEIKVYFALLEIESSTVGPIIEKAKVPHSKIYSILDKLKEKGLVSFVIKNNVKHFQASDPKNLISILSEKENEISKQKRYLVEKIIPVIEERRKMTTEKQEATVYESMEGMRAAHDYILNTLKRGDEYRVFMIGPALRQQRVIDFFKGFHRRRIQKGIKANLLSETLYRNIVEKNYIYRGMTIRFTPKKMPVGTFIFKNHIMLVNWDEKPSAFIIKSKRNYEHYKEFFEDMWKTAKA